MPKTEHKEEKGNALAKDFIRVLFLMYFVTCILLLLLALVLYKMDTPEAVSKIWLIAVYIISGFFGGFLIGKRTKTQKYLWGLFIGLTYFAILFAVSLALYKGLSGDVAHLLTTLALCAASGTVGGMVS